MKLTLACIAITSSLLIHANAAELPQLCHPSEPNCQELMAMPETAIQLQLLNTVEQDKQLAPHTPFAITNIIQYQQQLNVSSDSQWQLELSDNRDHSRTQIFHAMSN
ncbi:MAG: hypothetical protein ACRCT7_12190 [Shewanella sp.]|uniref:hypothetical protein n=1 Tax=Shewanella sp. SNU WT4 TaxID=2590015 RepID=UPI00112EAF8A|nr:hypothetical protein [Shewanella sp. SNU WT4]QDF65985.1 hypothetical protein FJQ87_04220 [Shewanella sp. SNU WT4]